jgi:cell division protein ZipA
MIMTIEIGVWIALAVSLVVLAKTIWDLSQRQSTKSERVEPVLADEQTSLGDESIRVVARAERHLLVPKTQVEPALVVDTDLAQNFAANEELETTKFFLEPEPVSNVASWPTRTEVILTAEDDMINEDDFIDAVAMSSSQSKVVEAQDYIVLYVVAGRVPFDGERLLKAVSGYGLRFGEMGMFHRHEHPNCHGNVLFSMARVDETGAFDLETMGAEFIPAITLFMALPNEQPYVAYDTMVDTAKRLANEFCGQALDQQHQPLNRQLIQHYREHVMEFTRHHLMSKAV